MLRDRGHCPPVHTPPHGTARDPGCKAPNSATLVHNKSVFVNYCNYYSSNITHNRALRNVPGSLSGGRGRRTVLRTKAQVKDN